MNDTITKVATGSAGVTLTEVAQHINLDGIHEGTTLLTQIIILVATLIGLFKKKKA